jgi:DeoR/GlpR family transcriptional regulator of sugar metabolism
MFKEERQNKIRAIIEKDGKASVKELASEFKVSTMTIRRDLVEMANRNVIERTHGGAISLRTITPLFTQSYLVRTSNALEEKQSIGRAIAKLIKPGEIIYLSPGTTTYWVAHALSNRSDITIVTSSIPIALLLVQNVNIEIIMTGGKMRRDELSLVGYYSKEAVQQLNIGKAIMGTRGIHPKFGLTSDFPRELMNDRSFLRTIKNIIIVADHTKFGFVAKNHTAPITAVKAIVTTPKAPKEIVDAIREKGVEVILTKDE